MVSKNLSSKRGIEMRMPTNRQDGLERSNTYQERQYRVYDRIFYHGKDSAQDEGCYIANKIVGNSLKMRPANRAVAEGFCHVRRLSGQFE